MRAVRDKWHFQNWIIGVVLALVMLFVLRPILFPDPIAKTFYQARHLEDLGQLEQARRLYELIFQTQPKSTYAPRALEREAALLAGMARTSGKSELFREAITAYQQLASTYPSDALAGDALVSAGTVAVKELGDTALAKQIYNQLFQQYGNNQEYAAEATLQLGNIALKEKDPKLSQTLLQSVLQRYPLMTDRCAEAQFNLGVAYETLFNNDTWAINAYKATIARYPKTIWATNAQERLGLLAYRGTSGLRDARRVQIEIAPLPESGINQDSIYAAALPMLAARGLEVNETIVRGWSGRPFFAGFVSDEPGRVVQPHGDGFANVIANAGLVYEVRQWQDDKQSLSALLTEIDYGRPPIVYSSGWSLAVGYDSAQFEILLQNKGARVEVQSWKDFLALWKRSSPLGGGYTMLTFWSPGDRARAPRARQVTAEGVIVGATPSPQPTSAQPSLTPPTYTYKVDKLSSRDAHRRAVRRAATLMRQSRDGKALLNLAALDALAGELRRLSQSTPVRQDSPIPAPETGEADNAVSPTPAAAVNRPVKTAPRAQALLGWFDAPLKNWVERRQQSADYLDAAADALGESRLHTAAGELRKSAEALQAATAALPNTNELSDDGNTLNDTARTALAAVAEQIEAARSHESQATKLMSQ